MTRRTAVCRGAAAVAVLSLASPAAFAEDNPPPAPSRQDQVDAELERVKVALRGVPPELVMSPALINQVRERTGRVQECGESIALLHWIAEEHNIEGGFRMPGARGEFNAHDWLRRQGRTMAA